VCRVTDSHHDTGKVALGLHADTDARFANLVVRALPAAELARWSFTTSRFEGWLDHLESFTGDVHEVQVSATPPDLATAKAQAASALSDGDAALAAARSDLEAATESTLTELREAALAAVQDRHDEAVAAFESLYDEQFGIGWRQLPDEAIELSAMRGAAGERYALLLESPEPLDWTRLSFVLREEVAGVMTDVATAFCVWNDDATRALIFYSATDDFPAGTFELEGTYRLDVGEERPVLRRSGSTQAEVACVDFSL